MEALLAHQGGWDELAMFLAPIIVAVLVVRMIERRARQREVDESAEDARPPVASDESESA